MRVTACAPSSARPLVLGAALTIALVADARPSGAQQRAGRDSAAIPLDSLQVSVLRRPVTAARAPVAVTVLEGPRIQDGQLTLGLDEALVAVPGVVVNNRYNPSLGSRIAIRGFGARAAFGVRGIRLITDGIPATMPDGQSNLNNLDLGAAGRIEVIRGPASALHGNAAGGVVSIESEAPPPGAFALQARALAGDLDGRDGGLANALKAQVKVAGRWARGDYLASVSRHEVDGFRAFSASRQTLLNMVGHYALDDASRLTVVFNGVDQPVAESPGALPRDSLLKDPRLAWPANVRTGSGEVTRQAQLGVAWARSWGDARVDLAAYGLGRSLDNALSFGFIDLNRKAAGLRGVYSASLGVAGRALGFTAGADLETQTDERLEFDNVAGRPGTELRRDQTDRVSAVGPFLQAELELTPSVLVTLGARFDAVRFRTNDHFLGDGRDDSGDRTLRAFSPVAGMLVRTAPAFAVYANVATSFQTPTTTELINAPPAPGQPCCPAGFNEQLEPQRAVSIEAGVKGELAGRVGYDVALFHMNVRNALVPFQAAGAEGREFFRNAGESRHRGIEIGAHGDLRRVRMSAAYTYSDFVFIDDGLSNAFDGNRIPGVPPHHLFAGLRLDAGRGISVETELDYTSEYFATDANDPASLNAAATVVDLRLLATTRFGRIAARPFIAINNLTDERYNSSVVVNAFGGRYFEPAPGRNLLLGVTLGAGGWAR